MADNWQITIWPFIQLNLSLKKFWIDRFVLYMQYYTKLYFRDFRFIIDGIESKVLLQNIGQGTATGR